ncbi:hypothetical protein [Odoribacter laneus]|uniref:hypothetical protein n=1 Tax=Odoribacter laneus TaxID=626933 RepID=UPI0023F369D3|nr:hypothetical protein [Odoribacter laneus]
MKHTFLSLFCLAFFVNACAQSNIIDFISATGSAPVDEKIYITDVIYRDGKFDAIKERIERDSKFKQDYKDVKMGAVIDEAQLINYKSDTLYLLSNYYVPDASVSITIKTKKGVFDLIHNVDGDYSLRSLEDSYANIPEDEKKSDFLLYETIFTWNIDLLISLIKSSGGLLGSENVISATRIILKNNQILEKDIIHFEPALRWHLE